MFLPERRFGQRFLTRAPLWLRPTQMPSVPEQSTESMNISRYGVYFATDLPLRVGQTIQIRLRVPKELSGDSTPEKCFVGRVTHVQPGRAPGGMTGVGVQFLYFESADPGPARSDSELLSRRIDPSDRTDPK